jgi:hypothetical protein
MAKPTTDMTPFKVGQEIFRDWCTNHGVVVDVEMAADLVRRIGAAIAAERVHIHQAASGVSPCQPAGTGKAIR